MTYLEQQRIDRMVFLHQEAQRRHEEYQRNKRRLIAYNARRRAAGLAELSYPAMITRLAGVKNRDDIKLLTR